MAPKRSVFSDPQLNAFFNALMSSGAGVPGTTSSGTGARPVTVTKADFAAAARNAGQKTYSDGLSTKPLPPEVYDAANRVDSLNSNIESLGGKVKDQHKRPGILHRVLDVLSRPNYAMANLALSVDKLEKTKPHSTFGDRASALGGGIWGGLSGKHKTTFSDVIQYEHPKWAQDHKVLNAIAGVGLDIGLDPLTYTGLGAVGKVGNVGKAAKEIERFTQPLVDAGKLSKEHQAELALHTVTGRFESGASAAGRERDVMNLSIRAARAHGDLVKAEALKGGASLGDATIAATRAETDAIVQLRNLREMIAAEAPHTKALALTFGGLGGKKLQIAPAALTDAVRAPFVAAAKHLDPVKKTEAYFRTRFDAGMGMFPELHAAKLAAHSDASAVIEIQGRHWRQTFAKTDSAQRAKILQDALNAAPSGIMVPDLNAGGQLVDAGTLMMKRLNDTADSIQKLDFDYKRLQKLAAKEGLDLKKGSVLLPNGSKIADPQWVLSSLRQSGKIKDAGEAAFVLDGIYAKALAEKALYEGIANAYGVGTRTVKDLKAAGILSKSAKAVDVAALPAHQRPFIATQYLKNKGWREVQIPIKELEHHVFAPEVATGIEKIFGLLDDPVQTGKMLRQINNLTGKWKYFVTVPNPGFHIRNSIGDAMINHVDGVSEHAYAKALHVMRKRDAKYGTTSQSLLLQPDAMKQAANFQSGAKGYTANFLKNRNRYIDHTGNTPQFISEAQIHAGYEKYGMRQNYASDYGSAFTDPKNMGHGALRKANDAMIQASNNREDYFRLAHFIHLVQTNPSKAKSLDDAMKFAASRVRQTHFDYSDFTEFEKKVMSSVIPFYKWTRKSLPLQMQFMFTNPGRVMTIPKLQRSLQEMTGQPWDGFDYLNTDEVTPKWLRAGGFVSAGSNFGALGLMDKLGMKGEQGATSYVNVSNPFSDMLSQWGNAFSPGADAGPVSQVGSMLNPAIKTPIELFANKQFFSGAPIFSDKGVGDNARRLSQYLASQIPQANVPSQTVRGNRGTLAAFLTGITTQENTTHRMNNELIRQQKEAQKNLKRLQAKLGIQP